MARIFLVFGNPGNGKSTLAKRLNAEHRFDVIAVDNVYVEWVKAFCPPLYFEALANYIAQHYHHILRRKSTLEEEVKQGRRPPVKRRRKAAAASEFGGEGGNAHSTLPALKALVNSMLTSQGAEMDQMKLMLSGRGAQPLPA